MEDLSQFFTPLSAQWTPQHHYLLSVPSYIFSPLTSPILLAASLRTKGLDGNTTPERVVEAEENGLERGTK